MITTRLERVVRQTLDDRFGSDADLAAAIVAAVLDELREIRTIMTVEQLEALPEDSVINDAHGCTAKKQGGVWWWIATAGPWEPDLPALLLWQPEVDR